MTTPGKGGSRARTMGALLILVGAVSPQVARAGSWLPAGKMTQGRNAPTATLLAGGTVLVAGGDQGLPGLASADRFDPKTNTFTPQHPMNVARGGHAAVRLQDGRVLMVGGWDETGKEDATAEVFDPATGLFSRVGDMTTPRAGFTATLLPDGRVLVAGGEQAVDNQVMASATAELFNPATGQFQPTGSLVGPRFQHAAVALPDGRVGILGGAPNESDPLLRRVEIYDPATGIFTAHGETVVGRIDMTATLLSNGKIVLAGGLQVDSRGRIVVDNSLELYDPVTGQSAPDGTLSVPRADHVAVTLTDGRVLLAGGFTQWSPMKATNTAEVFDPATGQVSVTASMAAARAFATAVLLPDGRALVLGGSRPGLAPVATAEVYAP